MPERLDDPGISFRDGLVAEALSLGSLMATALPEQWNVVRKVDVPSWTPIRWGHLWKTSVSMQGKFVGYDPATERTGILPKNFERVAITYVDREAMDALDTQNFGSQHSVAYALGTTVMYGWSNKYKILGLESPDAEEYAFAMGVGDGPLQVAVGNINNDRRGIHMWLERKALRAGPVVPRTEVQAYIPQL